MPSRRKAACVAATVLMLSARALSAQEPSIHQDHEMADGAAMEEMSADSMGAGKHLRLTPHWVEQPGDRDRADSLVRVARAALAKYTDVGVAEQDGYRMFAPKVKRQRVYHYSNHLNALKARWVFDAAKPSALLYQPQLGGGVRLIGAMYTAPPNTSLEELNERIPLSIAQWHQHTSLCLPPGADRHGGSGDMSPTIRDPRFGARGTITTEAECNTAGGKFKKRMLGWMVHVNMFEGDDQVWQHRH
jgi:hypothetical protein